MADIIDFRKYVPEPCVYDPVVDKLDHYMVEMLLSPQPMNLDYDINADYPQRLAKFSVESVNATDGEIHSMLTVTTSAFVYQIWKTVDGPLMHDCKHRIVIQLIEAVWSEVDLTDHTAVVLEAIRYVRKHAAAMSTAMQGQDIEDHLAK